MRSVSEGGTVSGLKVQRWEGHWAITQNEWAASRFSTGNVHKFYRSDNEKKKSPQDPNHGSRWPRVIKGNSLEGESQILENSTELTRWLGWCLLHKREDLSLSPQHPRRWQVCPPRAGWTETGGFPQSSRASQSSQLVSSGPWAQKIM